jgi:hypothetical protein
MKLVSSVHGVLVLLALLVASCGSDGASGAAGTGGAGGEGGTRAIPIPPPEPLELTATAAGFDLDAVDAGYFEAISYGPYDENLFDIYLPASDEPTPLLI